MIPRPIKLLILVPIAIGTLLLSVANRHLVTLALNPFAPQDPLLSVTMPFFVFLFMALMIGVLAGSLMTWLSQGKYRKEARQSAHQARQWHDEADNQRKRVEAMSANTLNAASRPDEDPPTRQLPG